MCLGDRSAFHLFEGNGSQFSFICLCTMIWGQQNNVGYAFTQLSFVKSCYVDLFEAVGIYLVSPPPETYVLTES